MYTHIYVYLFMPWYLPGCPPAPSPRPRASAQLCRDFCNINPRMKHQLLIVQGVTLTCLDPEVENLHGWWLRIYLSWHAWCAVTSVNQERTRILALQKARSHPIPGCGKMLALNSEGGGTFGSGEGSGWGWRGGLPRSGPDTPCSARPAQTCIPVMEMP